MDENRYRQRYEDELNERIRELQQKNEELEEENKKLKSELELREKGEYIYLED